MYTIYFLGFKFRGIISYFMILSIHWNLQYQCWVYGSFYLPMISDCLSQISITKLLHAGNQTAPLSNGERYYYCTRETNYSREVLGRGWWKATSHVKKIHANNDDQLLVGNKRPLTFHRFKDNERNRNNAVKTNWIMYEYSLESRTTVLVLIFLRAQF